MRQRKKKDTFDCVLDVKGLAIVEQVLRFYFHLLLHGNQVTQSAAT